MALAQRVERICIRRSSAIWKTVDENCYYSKNLYNYANYIVRQEFITNRKWLKYRELDVMLNSSEPYKQLMSQPSQEVLRVLTRMWKSFFAAMRSWKQHPEQHLGMPKIPGYKAKDGRFPWFIKNNSCYVDDENVLHFQIKRLHGVTFRMHQAGKLLGIRFIPNGNNYVMEVVFEVEVADMPTTDPTRIAGIDLGINNLVTLVNNIGKAPIIINGKPLKAINQFYNKRKSQMTSDLMKRNGRKTSHRIADLTGKRNNRVLTYLHGTSKKIIDWCVDNEIDTLVCGINDGWKQGCTLGKVNTQNFTYIPYTTLIRQFEYKCQARGIRFITTDEAYTSGTSFLDDELPTRENYNKSRRISRGLFQAKSRLINADVNGAFQIVKKVFPNAFTGYGIVASDLTPLIINVG